MNRKTSIGLTVLFLLLALPAAVGKSAPTDLVQTIPPVVVSTSSAIAGCSTLDLNPGSAISGSSGWILASCLHGPAITFNGTTETPTFLLSPGWNSAVLQFDGPCQYPTILKTLAGPRLSGANMTSGSPISFSTWTNSTLPPGGFNYCFHYSNPALTGISSVAISWNP